MAQRGIPLASFKCPPCSNGLAGDRQWVLAGSLRVALPTGIVSMVNILASRRSSTVLARHSWEKDRSMTLGCNSSRWWS
ncbi:MAG: hypothetical protein Q6L68_06115, partial [Thermostichus sp. DG02_5_bins_236]